MARSPTKAKIDNYVTAAGEETLDFDDVTLRGEKKHVTFFFRRPKEPPNINPPLDSIRCRNILDSGPWT